MRNQYKILAEKYEQVNQEGRKPTNEIASNIGNKDPLFNKASMLLKSFYAQGYLDPAISLYGEELVTDAINKCKTINDVFQLFIVYKIINPNTPFNVFTDMVKNAPVGIP